MSAARSVPKSRLFVLWAGDGLLVGALWWFGRQTLPGPPVARPDRLASWWASAGPVDGLFATLRSALMGITALYLVVLTIVLAIALLATWGKAGSVAVGWLIDRAEGGGGYRILRLLIGLSLSGGVAAAAATPAGAVSAGPGAMGPATASGAEGAVYGAEGAVSGAEGAVSGAEGAVYGAEASGMDTVGPTGPYVPPAPAGEADRTGNAIPPPILIAPLRPAGDRDGSGLSVPAAPPVVGSDQTVPPNSERPADTSVPSRKGSPPALPAQPSRPHGPAQAAAQPGDPTVQPAQAAVQPGDPTVQPAQPGDIHGQTAGPPAPTGFPAPNDPHHATAPASGPPAKVGYAATWTVRPGDDFWSIAEAVMSVSGPPRQSEVAAYWSRLLAANRDRLPVPGDPDLLFPGDVLLLPSPPQRSA